MVQASEIRDEATLRAWLEGRPQRDAVAIAHRAALRVFPLWAAKMGGDEARLLGLTPLAFLWFLLANSSANQFGETLLNSASLHASRFAQREAQRAVSSSTGTLAQASRAALAADNDPIEATDCAADALSSAFVRSSGARGNFIDQGPNAVYFGFMYPVWTMFRIDAGIIENGQDCLTTPLRHPRELNFLADAEREFLSLWSRDPATWDFWRRWWEGARDGRPLDWELQRRVALIPPEEWEKNDPARIAELICGIEAEWDTETRLGQIIRDTPDDEDIVADPETGLLRADPRPIIEIELFEHVVTRITVAIERFQRDCAAPAAGNWGGVLIASIGPALIDLLEDLHQYRGRALKTHDAIEDGATAIRVGLDDCGLTDDRRAGRLLALLGECASDLRRNDARLLEIVQKREDDRFARMDAENRAQFLEACAGMAADSVDALRLSIERDIDRSTDTEASENERLRARYALTARLPRGARALRAIDAERAARRPSQLPRNAQAQAGLRSVADKVVGAADTVHKLDGGGRAAADWLNRVWTEVASGNFFGMWDWLSK